MRIIPPLLPPDSNQENLPTTNLISYSSPEMSSNIAVYAVEI